MNFLLILILASIAEISGEKLLPCTQVKEKICFSSQDYIPENEPEPMPNNINITLKILDVIGVDETQNTIKLLIYAFIHWQDNRLNISRSTNRTSYKINGADIWYPEIFIANSVQAQNLVSFHQDGGALNALYYYYSNSNHQIEYSTVLTITISCNMNFQSFPFDKQECNLDLKNWNGASNKIVLNSPKLLGNDEKGNEINTKELKINSNGRLEYDFFFKSLPSTLFTDLGFEYSMAHVGLHFVRTQKSREKIFSGYHLQTGIFSFLSLASFFSPPNAPIDRMGMLIVLYLIQMNAYNTVPAPPHRGFSLIETWFIGIQIPILIAILEYGLILAMKKFWPVQKELKETILRKIDLFTFFLSASFLFTFISIYWFA